MPAFAPPPTRHPARLGAGERRVPNDLMQECSTQRASGAGFNRVLVQVLAAAAEVYPMGRIAVRLSQRNFNEVGSPDFRGTFLYAASELNRLGLAYPHVMDGPGPVDTWYSPAPEGYTDYPMHAG